MIYVQKKHSANFMRSRVGARDDAPEERFNIKNSIEIIFYHKNQEDQRSIYTQFRIYPQILKQVQDDSKHTI